MNELIVSNNDIKEMAKAMGPLFNKKPDDMFALMLIAQAEGKHPAIAAQEYDIIQGRPAINSRSAQARFQLSGGKIEWKTRTDAEVSAAFNHPAGGSLTITWTIERAKKAGLTSKDNWQKYPAQMLSARVISEGVRAIFPSCLSGMYLPEEIEDLPEHEPRNVTPAPTAQPNHDKPLIKDVQDAEVETQEITDEDIAAAERKENIKEITAITKEIALIVKLPENGGWSNQDKIDLDIRGLLQAARDSFDPTTATVALRRAEIADKYRNGTDWPVIVKDLVDFGLNLEALDQRKAGLSA